jgi:hypothetical protein
VTYSNEYLLTHSSTVGMVNSDAIPGAIKNAFNAHYGHFGKYLIESNKIVM